jgi:hypothetical protein
MENKEAKGSIIVKKRDSRRYYYYVRSQRVKVDPDAKGKTRGTGKSKVVSNQTYLGTAEDVLSKLSAQSEIQEPVEIQSKPFELPAALFEMAERIGLETPSIQLPPTPSRGSAWVTSLSLPPSTGWAITPPKSRWGSGPRKLICPGSRKWMAPS